MIKSFKIKNIGFGPKYPLALIAGPCVIESKLKTFNIAKKLKQINADGEITNHRHLQSHHFHMTMI